MNKEIFEVNRKKLLDEISDNSIVILFSGEAPNRSADQGYKYAPNRNFYYMTGLEREKFILMITKRNEKISEKIFIEKSDPQLEKWIGKRMSKEEAQSLSGINEINFIESFEDTFNNLLLRSSFENIYLDLEKRGYNAINTISQNFALDLVKKYPYLKINDVYPKISDLRMIKTDEEIKNIKEAIKHTKLGIESLMNNSKPGLMEYQLEAYYDFTIKSNGINEKSFKTIAAAGKNATVLHYEDNNCLLNDGDLILFDLGCEYNNYCSDISRTFPINGKFSERQKQIYNIVLKAEIETIKAAKPGITTRELNEITKKVLSEECIKIGLIKEESELSKYYYHGVSHYLGLDTHDVGDYERKLEPGMVITVEPGLYIEEEGIGIRIEDDILITEEGFINLSEDIIKSIDDIEEFMNKTK